MQFGARSIASLVDEKFRQRAEEWLKLLTEFWRLQADWRHRDPSGEKIVRHHSAKPYLYERFRNVMNDSLILITWE